MLVARVLESDLAWEIFQGRSRWVTPWAIFPYFLLPLEFANSDLGGSILMGGPELNKRRF